MTRTAFQPTLLPTSFGTTSTRCDPSNKDSRMRTTAYKMVTRRYIPRYSETMTRNPKVAQNQLRSALPSTGSSQRSSSTAHSQAKIPSTPWHLLPLLERDERRPSFSPRYTSAVPNATVAETANTPVLQETRILLPCPRHLGTRCSLSGCTTSHH